MKKAVEKKIDDARNICHEVLVSLRRIIQTVDLHSRYLLRHYGLTVPQLVILQQLSKSGEMSIGELAKTVSLGQATVTGIISRLEQRGLVTRRRSEKDKRRVLVQTTKSCVTIIEAAPPPIQKTFIDEFNNLLDWEQNMIVSALQRIVSMMDSSQIKVAPLLTTEPLTNSDNQLAESTK
jgi:DNA-binding MarR family transcriptional regulator